MRAVDLEVALAADDAPRARVLADRLALLFKSYDPGAESAAEALARRLERGASPARLAGASADLERQLAGELHPCLALGAWARGAKLAAPTGNRGYFASGLPASLKGAKLPAATAARLKELGALDALSVDLAVLEEGIDELCAVW